jgi:hypothetical protein
MLLVCGLFSVITNKRSKILTISYFEFNRNPCSVLFNPCEVDHGPYPSYNPRIKQVKWDYIFNVACKTNRVSPIPDRRQLPHEIAQHTGMYPSRLTTSDIFQKVICTCYGACYTSTEYVSWNADRWSAVIGGGNPLNAYGAPRKLV